MRWKRRITAAQTETYKSMASSVPQTLAEKKEMVTFHAL